MSRLVGDSAPVARAVAATLYLVVLTVALHGQDAPKPPTTYTLQLKPSTEIADGKIAMVQARTAKDPDHYIVEGLTILQPVQVLVLTKDPADDVQLKLCKVRWDQPERTATTKGSGAAVFKLRTEGDMRILVSGPEPRDYQLIVWAGDDARPPMRPAFISMQNYERRHGGGSRDSSASVGGSPVMWVIAGALVLIALSLGAIALKGRRT